MVKKSIDLAVIGAGPAGMAAALAAVRAGVDEVLLLERLDEPGGILQQCIHNGFGLSYFKEELTGPEYAHRFIQEVKAAKGIQMKTGTTVTQLSPDRVLTVMSPKEGLVRYQAKAVVLTMGCRERPRGAINLPGTRPAGVYTAGMVQRLMNIEGYRPGNRAVILGSGDIGLIMARRLTLEGIEVAAVLELMPYSNGLTRNIVQCLEDYRIPLLKSHTVTEIRGDHRLKGIMASPVDHCFNPIPDNEFLIDCDLLVLSVGLIPENELSLMAGGELDPATGGPWVDSSYQTSVPGIFACGNVAHVHDLVDDVSEESWLAGTSAAAYIRGEHSEGISVLPVVRGEQIRSVVPQRILMDREATLYIRPLRPAKGVDLWVGPLRERLRIVNPGETIRFKMNPKDLNDKSDALVIRLEGGDL